MHISSLYKISSVNNTSWLNKAGTIRKQDDGANTEVKGRWTVLGRIQAIPSVVCVSHDSTSSGLPNWSWFSHVLISDKSVAKLSAPWDLLSSFCFRKCLMWEDTTLQINIPVMLKAQRNWENKEQWHTNPWYQNYWVLSPSGQHSSLRSSVSSQGGGGTMLALY